MHFIGVDCGQRCAAGAFVAPGAQLACGAVAGVLGVPVCAVLSGQAAVVSGGDAGGDAGVGGDAGGGVRFWGPVARSGHDVELISSTRSFPQTSGRTRQHSSTAMISSSIQHPATQS